MKIGLLGYGTVGRSIEKLLKDLGLGIEVKKILRRPGKASDPTMTENIDEILTDPEIDCVVEALSGPEPARDYIYRSLIAAKNVVTSNKAALASDFAVLNKLARERGLHLLYEASCGGGIPWLESIKKVVRLDEITAVSGILNGTCNYILDRMEREGLPFEDILKDAQALGYAEADPTADISGADIRNKAIISASLAYRLTEIEKDFPMSGIERITAEVLKGFLEKGKILRLMMLSVRKDERYAVGIVPVLFDKGCLEHAVKKNYNCGRITGSIVGPLMFYGQGAGGNPTADAVIQDLISIKNKTAEHALLDRRLAYDESLLKGTGHFSDGHVRKGSLAELVRRAHKDGVFLAFEPANQE